MSILGEMYEEKINALEIKTNEDKIEIARLREELRIRDTSIRILKRKLNSIYSKDDDTFCTGRRR